MADIISDKTYNLLAIMLSKLEGLAAYDTYLEDVDGDERNIIEQIRRDDERHAEMLRACYREAGQRRRLQVTAK